MASPRKFFLYKGRLLQAYDTTKPEPQRDPRCSLPPSALIGGGDDGVNLEPNPESQSEKQSLASSTNSETKENPPISQLLKK